MHAIAFTIELLEPMLATGLEGDPNSDVSLDYIPGSLLRGAIVGKYLRQTGKSELNTQDDTESKLFFDGTVRYLNAYPLAPKDDYLTKQQTLPVPFSWHRRKDDEEKEGTNVSDLCFVTPKDAFGDEANKTLSKHFFAFTVNQRIILIEPQRRLAVHTQRNPRKGRAVQGDGAVFRYESVAAGNLFGGVIIAADKQLLEKTVKNLLQDAEVSLGGSRTGGYGRARIVDVSAVQDDWFEAHTQLPMTILAGKTFFISLLSHAIIRDDNGQHQANSILNALPTSVRNKVSEEKKKTFKHSELIGGFNRKWGLPLPQTVALKAGSIFAFKAEADLDAKDLKDLATNCIGERLTEGFGRIAIDLNQEGRDDFPIYEIKQKSPAQIGLTTENAQTVAEKMVERILRARLEHRLVKQVSYAKIKRETIPPNSQLARLRAAIRQALRDDDKKPVTDFLGSLRSTARDHFTKAKVEIVGVPKSERLLNWVQERLDDAERFGGETAVLGKADENGVGQKSASSDDPTINLEYRLRLIDGVLARAAKQNRD